VAGEFTAIGRATRQVKNVPVRPRQRVHWQRYARTEQGHGYRLALYRAGKPMQNGFIESFNGRMRAELLDETYSSNDARQDRQLIADAAELDNWIL
jgi:transposase InsO family protein